MSRSRSRSTADIRDFALKAAQLCDDRKCSDVILLDVRGRSQVCDFIVVASGTSERQMRTVAREIEELGEELGHKAWRSSVDEGGSWIVIDCVNVVVHLFEPDQRLYYDLEGLWTGAPRLSWRRSANSAGTATTTATAASRRREARLP